MKNFLAGGFLEHIDHECVLERGPIRAALSDLVRKYEVGLVVLGTHGRGGIGALFLGSVAEEVLRFVACPVLTIGPAVPAEPKDSGHVRQILFATDFGPASLAALPYAIAFAQEDNSKLIMLHVLPTIAAPDAAMPWYTPADLIEKQERGRQRTLNRLAELIPKDQLSCPPELVVPFGTLPWGILHVAEDRAADLIVMGVNEAAFVRASAHTPWATAHGVLRHARCPVLTVRS
jgi:nucleotide-binding universal stress UspA family protein